MPARPIVAAIQRRVSAGLPFVEALARRVAASMPPSIEIGDLIQEGVIGLIDAAQRFDEARGIKFETFAERRVRGAMIDALRRGAWPRGLRRQRRELDDARQALRLELGHEPSIADLAQRLNGDEASVTRTIVRINTIEATSPLATGDDFNDRSLPALLVPSQPASPHETYEALESRQRIRQAMASLPEREQTVIGLYYYGDATMKDIGVRIGVNESRVSQLHARAIRHLRAALAVVDEPVVSAATRMPGAPRPAAVPRLNLVTLSGERPLKQAASAAIVSTPAVVLPYKARTRRRALASAAETEVTEVQPRTRHARAVR